MSQNLGNSFSTTSAIYFVNASTTIPKTYTANTFTNTNTFTNAPIFSSLTSGGLAVDALGNVYKAATTTAGTGLTYSGNAFNVNTTQNITTLSNLSSGVVSSNSGALYNSATTTLSTSGPLSFSANPAVFGSSPISLSISQANSTTDGYLSQGDWNSFNNRLSTSTLGLFDKGYFFSTTSANYFLSVNQGAAFSTTSANYWSSLGLGFSTTSAINFVNSSTTIPKTYTANIFTSSNIFDGGLTVSNLNGPLQANNGVVSATSSVGVTYGGTGLTVAPTYGNILVGNSAGGYTLSATNTPRPLGLNLNLRNRPALIQRSNRRLLDCAVRPCNRWLSLARRLELLQQPPLDQHAWFVRQGILLLDNVSYVLLEPKPESCVCNKLSRLLEDAKQLLLHIISLLLLIAWPCVLYNISKLFP